MNQIIDYSCAHEPHLGIDSFLSIDEIGALQLKTTGMSAGSTNYNMFQQHILPYHPPAAPLCPKEEPRRRITFDKSVQVRVISGISRQDVNKVWYTQAEYRRIRREMNKTIARMERGNHRADTEDHCAHGLEHKLSPVELAERKNYNLISVLSVLVEQEEQLDNCTYNPEAVADMYFRCSRLSRYEAAMRGEVTAKEASKFCTNTDSIIDSKGEPMSPRKRRTQRSLKAVSLFTRLQFRKEYKALREIE